MRPEVEEQVRRLPDRPGIYVFRDSGGKALYVGKAKSLRKRVASYKRRADDLRLATMIEEAAALEFVETGSEAEALLLENNWIKSHKPRYNVLLRDDKTYPYVKLTLRDDYPRVTFTRRIFNDGVSMPASTVRGSRINTNFLMVSWRASPALTRSTRS